MTESTRSSVNLFDPRPTSERIVYGIVFCCGLLSILTTVGIVMILLVDTIGFFNTLVEDASGHWVSAEYDSAANRTTMYGTPERGPWEADAFVGKKLYVGGKDAGTYEVLANGPDSLTVAGNVQITHDAVFRVGEYINFWQVFGDTEWTPLFSSRRYGIWALISGTFWTTFIALLVALPLGLLVAVYLSEFASTRVRKTLKPILETLAGIPTVVYGYFALTFVTPVVVQPLFGLFGVEVDTFNCLSAGLVMGVMILPTIASLSEDAIYAVPPSLREGGYALGATKLSTVFRVVIPAAWSGIGAAVILGLSRAIGETMIVAVAAGQQPQFTTSPLSQTATMTAYMVQVASGDNPHGTVAYHALYFVGFCLFVMTFSLNLVAYRLRRRILKGAA